MKLRVSVGWLVGWLMRCVDEDESLIAGRQIDLYITANADQLALNKPSNLR